VVKLLNTNFLLSLRAGNLGVVDATKRTSFTLNNIECSQPGYIDANKKCLRIGNDNECYIKMILPEAIINDFTISAWINMDTTQLQAESSLLFWYNDYSSLLTGIYLLDDISQKPSFWKAQNPYTRYLTYQTAMSKNVWYHFALTRKSGTTRMFLNGIKSSASCTTVVDISQKNIAIGTLCFTGYLDDLCVIKDSALWVDNFTPPTYYLYDIMQNIKDTYKDSYKKIWGYK